MVQFEKSSTNRGFNMSKQNVEVQISLHYDNQPSEPINGQLHPTRETVMRDLYEMLRDGKSIGYKEIRTTVKEKQ